MTEIMGSEQGEETTGNRENFIGRVNFSNVDCDCEHCQKGDDSGKEAGLSDEELASDIDHLYNIQALSEYDSEFNEFGINVSKSWQSKWMVFTAFFENNIGTFDEVGIEDLEDLTEYLEGRIFEFRDITWDEDEELVWENSPNNHTENLGEMFEDSQYQPNSMLVPVREVTDDEELAQLGEEDDGEVEEVDF